MGAALQEVDVPRDQLFITTKVLKNVNDPENALKTSLKKLKVDYVDLYLIHAPFDVEIEKAWKMVDAAHEKEQRAKETIQSLRIEINNLSKLVEQGAGMNDMKFSLYEIRFFDFRN